MPFWQVMIRAFADKHTAAIFMGLKVIRLPKEIQNTARCKLKQIADYHQKDGKRSTPVTVPAHRAPRSRLRQ